jgi:hypothetical protein
VFGVLAKAMEIGSYFGTKPFALGAEHTTNLIG